MSKGSHLGMLVLNHSSISTMLNLPNTMTIYGIFYEYISNEWYIKVEDPNYFPKLIFKFDNLNPNSENENETPTESKHSTN